MVIDSHVHLKHADAAGTEYPAATIVQVMDAVGIDKSVVFAISTTTEHSIEMAQDARAQFPYRLIPYINVEPTYSGAVLGEVDRAVSELGFRGLKMHLGFGVPPQSMLNPFVELAGARGVPILIDCVGRDDVVAEMARAYPGTSIIVAHLGRYLCEDPSVIDTFIGLAETLNNVFLDVSGVVLAHKIREAVERVGAGKVVFGTDGPHKQPDLAGYARRELNKIRALGLSPDAEAAVLGTTIAKLLKLQPPDTSKGEAFNV